MRAILGVGLLVALAGVGAADDKKDEKIDPKKLVGKWELQGLKKGDSLVLELTRDGKAVMVAGNGKEEFKMNGTYKLASDKLLLDFDVMGLPVKQTIPLIKLTDDEMETKGPSGKNETYRRVKSKPEK
jgi:uncharacterized protein (TIGR03066 family)